MKLKNSETVYTNISLETISLISKSLNDNWANTPVAGLPYLQPGAKGAFGEAMLTDLLTSLGHIVTGKENPGHDRFVGKIKVEIKFSALNAKNGFIFNHFGVGKDWERAILVAHTVEDSTIIWFTKADFITHLQDTYNFFSRQQGGKGGGNDDWMYNTTRSKANDWENFLKLPWVKSFEEW
jgi:hypothetical protein